MRRSLFFIAALALCAVATTSCKDDDPAAVAVSEVRVSPTTASVEVGKTTTLTAQVIPATATDKTLTWESKHPQIATVADGVVTGVSVGVADIEVSAGGKSSIAKVTVTESTEPEPVPTGAFTVSAGWDIYDGGQFRYGPSMIINDDESMDIWFATPGDIYVHPDDREEMLLFNTSNGKQPLSMGTTNTVGEKFTVDESFYSISVCCPSWEGSPCHLRISLYTWNTDYATTVAGTALDSKEYTNYGDGEWLYVANDDEFPAGTYLVVLDQGTTDQSGVWYRPGTAANATGYLNGNVWGTNNLESRITFQPEIRYWDQISYRRFTDGGHQWSAEEMVLHSTENSYDHNSICDPGVFKLGNYYYIGYTSTLADNGKDNDVFIARGPNPDGPLEKWNGSGWTTGTDVQPMIEYDGASTSWGAGEPSFVVLDNTIYVYYSWLDGSETTRLATANASDPNWPANLTQRGTAIDKSAAGLGGTDAADVKYNEMTGTFQAVHTASRMSADSYIVLWQSPDGINDWTILAEIHDGLKPSLHNCGWSGDASGHIKPGVQQFLAYAYGPPSPPAWNTFMHPINFQE